MGLGLRLSASAAEARRMKPRLQREARVPRHLRQQQKARRFPPAPRHIRTLPSHRSSAAVVGGGVQRRFGLKPASPPGGRQRQKPPPTSQAPREARPTTYPQRRNRNHASNICFNPIDSTRGTLIQHSRKDVSNTKPAPRRQTTADLDPQF